jgi:hypothetical protein
MVTYATYAVLSPARTVAGEDLPFAGTGIPEDTQCLS